MSTDYAAVIYWYVAQSLLEQSPKVTQFSYALRDHGYELSHEGDLDKLCQQATSIANAPQHSMFILSGEPADIIVATVRLRTTSGQFGILPLMSSHDEAAVTQALLCGADNHVDPDASSSLFLASVGSVLRRIREGAGLKPEANKWTLLDEAWSVLSPDGARVSLTTIERAFFQALADAPDYKVSHLDLLLFLSLEGEREQSIKINRLGVIVSRLRRKFEAAGLHLPLKSVHNWGYMFAAPLQRR